MPSYDSDEVQLTPVPQTQSLDGTMDFTPSSQYATPSTTGDSASFKPVSSGRFDPVGSGTFTPAGSGTFAQQRASWRNDSASSANVEGSSKLLTDHSRAAVPHRRRRSGSLLSYSSKRIEPGPFVVAPPDPDDQRRPSRTRTARHPNRRRRASDSPPNRTSREAVQRCEADIWSTRSNDFPSEKQQHQALVATDTRRTGNAGSRIDQRR